MECSGGGGEMVIIMLDRSVQHFDSNGNLLSESYIDLDWDIVKIERKRCLEKTDLWYLNDRWEKLTTTQKDKLNTFRQTLRDLPSNYESANDAADNFPIPEDWF